MGQCQSGTGWRHQLIGGAYVVSECLATPPVIAMSTGREGRFGAML